MSKKKSREVHFIIPKPVREVKSHLASYKETKHIRFRGFDYYTVINFIPIEYGTSWNFEIKRVPFGSIIFMPRKLRFAGKISYHDLESTSFEGKFVVNNNLEKYFLGIFSTWLCVVIGLWLTDSANLAEFVLMGGGLLIIANAFLQWATEISLYETNRDKILEIVRDFAPDDVII